MSQLKDQETNLNQKASGHKNTNLGEEKAGDLSNPNWSSDEVPAKANGRTASKRVPARSQKKTPKYKKVKVKSLGHFCQQFIRLFVTWKDVLSLEEAAKQISVGEVYDEKLLKTKIRRLYDIANVLQSIGLIHKTQMSNSRKPAFKWVGLSGVVNAIKEIKDLVRTA